MGDYFGYDDIYDEGSDLNYFDNPETIEEQRQREAFDAQFKDYFNPDVSKNSWYDRPYVARYAGNPDVENFLRQKGDLLKRRGEYIATQADKGNLEPFVKHSQWLKKQGVLPSDALPASDFMADFSNRYGFSEAGGLAIHDLYAHAIPERYMGFVDKSMPKGITAADEARAVLIESTGGIQSGDTQRYDLNYPDEMLKNVRLDVEAGDNRVYRDLFLPDIQEEVSALSESYIKAADKAGWLNAFGTRLDPKKDPRVSDPDPRYDPQKWEGTPWEDSDPSTIKFDIREATDKRFPSLKPKDVADFIENAAAPYARDVATSDMLTLAPEVYENLSYTQRTPDNLRTLLENTMFSSDPISAGVQAIRQNMRGAAGGAALTLLNDEVAKALDKNDFRGAATAAAKDVATGAVLEAGTKAAAPVLRRVAPAAAARVIPAVAGAARVGIPAAVGAGLFNQGRTGSALDVLTNKASTVVPGLRANPKTDLGRRAGNEARYILNSIFQNRVPYLKGRLF